VTLRTRVNRLETTARRQRLFDPSRCPGCCHRVQAVLVRARRYPDGTEVTDPAMPAPCLECGRVPEQVIQIVEPMTANLSRSDELCAIESGI
jgi:hypothetical protein